MGGEGGDFFLGDEVVATDVELVLAPDLGVKGLGVVRVVVSLGLGGGVLVEPNENREGLGADVGGPGLAVIVALDHGGYVDVVAPQELLDLERRLPVGRVIGGGDEDAFFPVDVLVYVELAAELGILLVVVHDGVGKEVSVPVGDHAEAVLSGDGVHLVDDAATQFVGHDVEGVVDTDDQGLLVEIRVAGLLPPFLELEGVRDNEFAGFVGVLGLAKVDEFLVDVDTNAGNGHLG
mmetsp:Transcript_19158/g.39457  ORF Transcript_19158/g.39457 Transcript_19158/m.39457 type:complete len:235 (+) Transcript_19158:1341-2045(+)